MRLWLELKGTLSKTLNGLDQSNEFLCISTAYFACISSFHFFFFLCLIMTCAIKKMQNICASSFRPLYFGTPAMHHFQIPTSVNLFKLNCLDQTGQFFYSWQRKLLSATYKPIAFFWDFYNGACMSTWREGKRRWCKSEQQRWQAISLAETRQRRKKETRQRLRTSKLSIIWCSH